MSGEPCLAAESRYFNDLLEVIASFAAISLISCVSGLQSFSAWERRVHMGRGEENLTKS